MTDTNARMPKSCFWKLNFCEILMLRQILYRKEKFFSFSHAKKAKDYFAKTVVSARFSQKFSLQKKFLRTNWHIYPVLAKYLSIILGIQNRRFLSLVSSQSGRLLYTNLITMTNLFTYSSSLSLILQNYFLLRQKP